MTDLIEVKTAELTGEALGWAVGIAEGLDLFLAPPQYGNPWRVFLRVTGAASSWPKRFNPWQNWELGGHLIEKHSVSLHCPRHDSDCWAAWITQGGKDVAQGAPLPLPAACRAIVSAKLGAFINVPKELLP